MSTNKTYKASTHISINVILPSKKNLHISFTPLSNGSSVFSTDNKDLQKAIERHYRFGSLFVLSSEVTVPERTSKKDVSRDEVTVKEEKTDDLSDTGNIQEAAQEPSVESSSEESVEDADISKDEGKSLTKVHITDLASAKDYLADKFGISRTALRSQKSIMEHANANGIEFVGL